MCPEYSLEQRTSAILDCKTDTSATTAHPPMGSCSSCTCKPVKNTFRIGSKSTYVMYPESSPEQGIPGLQDEHVNNNSPHTGSSCPASFNQCIQNLVWNKESQDKKTRTRQPFWTSRPSSPSTEQDKASRTNNHELSFPLLS